MPPPTDVPPTDGQPNSVRPQVLSRVLTALAALAGLQWLLKDQYGNWDWTNQNRAAAISAIVATILMLFRPVRDWVGRIAHALATPSPRVRGMIALALGAGAAVHCYVSASHAGRVLIPSYHDEQMYLLQARMLATGHLWLPAHALPQFFETFHVFVRPVYAPIYFPGTALMYAPHVWLHVPPWIISLAVAGGIVSTTYLIVAELLGNISGIIAALFLVALNWFRYLALMPMSHPVLLLLGLLMVWAFLRWRTQKATRWAITFGVLSGWAAITRPLDAACFAVPLAVAIICELRKGTLRDAIRSLAMMVVAAAPFLAMQLRMDVAVTGHLFESPAAKYNREYWPESLAGRVGEVPHRPPTSLLQIQEYYDDVIVRQTREYRQMSFDALLRDRVQLIIVKMLPSPLLLALIPIGLLQVFRRRRWVLVGMLPLLVGVYVFYPFFLPQYALMAAPALLFLVLLGGEGVANALGWKQVRIGVSFVACVVAVAIFMTALPEFQQPARRARGRSSGTPLLVDVHRQLSTVPAPAIVLFRFTSNDVVREVNAEPVYNVDAAQIDDAPIIRAHDLGIIEDRKLIDYYAKRQPERMLYIYLRKERKLVPWGRAKDLAQAPLRYPDAAEPQAGEEADDARSC